MKSKLFFFIIFLSFLCNYTIFSKEYNVAVANLPTANYYVALLKAIGEETKNNLNIEVMPMARSIYLIENNQVDIQCPIIEIPDPKIASNLKFDYSTAIIYKLVFVLYSNKNKQINIEELKKGNPKNYKIETDTAHINYFNFTCIGSSNIEASLKKVDSGTIDGYIYSMMSTDIILKKLDLKKIKRQYFNIFDVKYLLGKGKKNGEIDKMLTDGLLKLKANGKYKQIMGDFIKKAENYIDWQP